MNGDRSGQLLVAEGLPKFIESTMELVDWQQVCDSDFLVELLLAKAQDDVLSYSGSRTYDE